MVSRGWFAVGFMLGAVIYYWGRESMRTRGIDGLLKGLK